MTKVIMALCALSFFLSSCSEDKTATKFARVNLVVEPSSFDPMLARNLSSLFLARHLHEGLFRYEGEQVVPALASSYQIKEEGLTYIISLKEAYYSDGSLIKAQDFVQSLQTAFSKETLSDYASIGFIIKNAYQIKKGLKQKEELGVFAQDDKTLCFSLTHPYEDFLALLTHPVFFPVKKQQGDILYSGPFVLKSHVPNAYIELVKNEKYYDANKVQLNELKGYFINDETATLMFEKGEIDFIGSPLGAIPQDSLHELSQKNLLHFSELLATCFIRINTTKQGLDDLALRVGLTHAVCRKNIVNTALLKQHLEAISFVPKSLHLDVTHLPDNHFLLERKPQELTLKYSSSDARMQKVACLIKQSVEAVLGIKIDLIAKEMKMLTQDLRSLNYDLMLGSWIADIKDPENFLELFKEKSSSINGTGWENEDFKKHLELAKYDVTKRKYHLAKAENILLNECPVIPLFQYNMIYAKDKNLEGYSLNSLGILDFKKAYRK